MKSYDFEAYVVDGEIFCCGCAPDDSETHPIFADSEWDHTPVCCVCGTEHDYVTVIPVRPEETHTVEVSVGTVKVSLDDLVDPDWVDIQDVKDGKEKLWIIGNEFGVLAVALGCEQDAINAAVDADKLDSMLVDQADETENDCHLGNASEPFDLTYCWMVEYPVDNWLEKAVQYFKETE